MTFSIHPSAKFYHGREQYYAVAGGCTLLRMTYGSSGGKPGGAIKTATASDHGAEPVYGDGQVLTEAMRRAVQKLGGRAEDVTIKVDRKGRWFGEITEPGTRDQFIRALHLLAEQMEDLLGRPSEIVRDGGYSDLRDLHRDLCVVEGEPIYLSDGVYLGSDGRMFE
jgi:hypothetical protein